MTAPKNIEQENKPKPSLLPLDILIDFLEPAYREGLIKYSRESWRGGFYIADMFDATLRHLTAFFYENQDIDPDSSVGKHHLGGALFSILCMCQTLRDHPELDNRTHTKQDEEDRKEIMKQMISKGPGWQPWK